MQSPERKTPASDHAVQDGVPRFGWRCYVLRCPKRRDAAVPTVRGMAPEAGLRGRRNGRGVSKVSHVRRRGGARAVKCGGGSGLGGGGWDAARGFPTRLGGCGRVGRVLRAVRRSSAFCG